MIRLRELRSELGLSLRELAEKLDISYSSVGKYERGEAQPSFEILFKIASFFDVTTDYLIGYSDIRTKNMEYKFISEKTGLSLRAIESLYYAKKSIDKQQSDADSTVDNRNTLYLDTVNTLLASPCELLIHITEYLHFSATHYKNFYDKSTVNLSPISELELWDDVEKMSYSDDWDMWSKALLLVIEEELVNMRNAIQYDRLIKCSESNSSNKEAPTD